jgi:hypothetical protein
MAKLTISRIFELSKALDTEAGTQLEEPLQFLSDMAEQVLRLLRNQLTFGDNFQCIQKRIGVRHNTPTQVDLEGRRATMVLPAQVVSPRYVLAAPVTWYYDGNGKFQVLAQLSDRLANSRASNLVATGGPGITVTQTSNARSIGDIVQLYGVQGGDYDDQLATVTAATGTTWSATLVGTGTVTRVSAQGILTAPPPQSVEVPLDLLILY